MSVNKYAPLLRKYAKLYRTQTTACNKIPTESGMGRKDHRLGHWGETLKPEVLAASSLLNTVNPRLSTLG